MPTAQAKDSKSLRGTTSVESGISPVPGQSSSSKITAHRRLSSWQSLSLSLRSRASGLELRFGLHRLQQLESLGGDVGDRLALVFAAAGATDQAPGLQAVDEARDVGSAFDHAVCDLAAWMPLGMHSAQDSQDVVLRAGESMPLADLVHQVVKGAGGYGQAENWLPAGDCEVALFQSSAEGLGHRVCYSQNSELLSHSIDQHWRI